MARPKKPYTEKRGQSEYPYRVRWPLPPDPDGVVHWGSASGFADDDSAMEHGYEQMLAAKSGSWIDPRKAATPFGEFAEKWLASHKRSTSTNDNRRYLLDAVILKRWATTPIADLNWDEVKEWANSLAIPRNTVDHAVGLMTTMLTSAVDAKMIGGNPLAGRKRHAGVKKPANLAPKKVVWCTAEQSAAIAARMVSPIDGVMQIFQTFMGPRVNEMLALHRIHSFAERTDMVDGRPWTRRVMIVGEDDGSLEPVEVEEVDDDGVVRVKRRLQPAAPKNRFSVRETDMPPFLEDLVDLHLVTWPHDYLFATASGEFRHFSNFNKRIKRATEGWPETPTRRGVRGRPAAPPILPGLASQGNRHGHATMMADWGLPEVLRRWALGQKTPGMAGVYEHPTPGMCKRRVDLLEDLWWSEGVADVYLAAPNALQVERRKRDPEAKIIPIPLPKQGYFSASG
jgi:hypothetical protein